MDTPQTPLACSTESYVNPAFTTDSLEDGESDENALPSPPSLSAKRYTFTPRRVAKLPRAWERKPATPFAPRTETQKIWKRVPLGELQTNGQVVNGTEKAHLGALKSVKRLKAERASQGGIYLSTKWDEVQDVDRRKFSGNADITDCTSRGIGIAQVAAEQAAGGSQADEDATAGENCDSTAEIFIACVEESPIAEIDDGDDHNGAPEAEARAGDRSLTQEPDDVHTDDQVSSQQKVSNAEGSSVPASEAPRVIVNQETPQDIGQPRHERATDAASGEEAVQENSEQPAIKREAEANSDEKASEPSRLDRVSGRRSSLVALFTGSGLICPPEPFQEHSVNTATEMSAPATDDDTAFLHDFLNRARAQKAAKAPSNPQKPEVSADSPPAEQRHLFAELDTNSPSPSKSVTHNFNPQETTDDESEAKASSPCRRSNRTRLPRPQKIITTIPSNIPVRRSNGTEFIFLQRTEAQEIALVTRANTKRNKGDAIHPKMKLPLLNDSTVIVSPSKSPRKKRIRKAVSWDDKLAQFRNEVTHEQTEIRLEPQESSSDAKPRARKMRNLGTVNGTPAPKRGMGNVETVSQIPERRLRSRIRS